MEAIIVFGVVGAFAMSAALCANQLLKLPEEEQPEWVRGKSGNTKVLMAGNLYSAVLVATIVYGFFHLQWWIPLVCLVLTFPVIHVVILEKLLGLSKGFFISGTLAVLGSPALWLFWSA